MGRDKEKTWTRNDKFERQVRENSVTRFSILKHTPEILATADRSSQA